MNFLFKKVHAGRDLFALLGELNQGPGDRPPKLKKGAGIADSNRRAAPKYPQPHKHRTVQKRSPSLKFGPLCKRFLFQILTTVRRNCRTCTGCETFPNQISQTSTRLST